MFETSSLCSPWWNSPKALTSTEVWLWAPNTELTNVSASNSWKPNAHPARISFQGDHCPLNSCWGLRKHSWSQRSGKFWVVFWSSSTRVKQVFPSMLLVPCFVFPRCNATCCTQTQKKSGFIHECVHLYRYNLPREANIPQWRQL